MIGVDFTFGEHSLSDFGFVMANPEQDENTGLGREVLKGSTTLTKYEPIVYGAKYSDILNLPFLIIKDDCENTNVRVSQDELRELNTWLTYSHLPQQLTVSFEESSPIEYYGIFTEITPYVIDGLNGLYLTFTCTSPFAYEQNKLSFVNSTSNYEKTFDCSSDENTYIYPIVKIHPDSTGVYSICNENENKTMQLKLSASYSEYIIDCKLKRIIADGNVLSMSDVEWDIDDIVDFNNVATGTVTMYWLRFTPGINPLTFNGNGTFDITCKSPIKIGGYPYD